MVVAFAFCLSFDLGQCCVLAYVDRDECVAIERRMWQVREVKVRGLGAFVVAITNVFMDLFCFVLLYGVSYATFARRIQAQQDQLSTLRSVGLVASISPLKEQVYQSAPVVNIGDENKDSTEQSQQQKVASSFFC